MYPIYVNPPTNPEERGDSPLFPRLTHQPRVPNMRRQEASVDKKSVSHGVKTKRTSTEKKPADKRPAKIETEATVTVDRRASRMDRRAVSDRRVRQIPVAVERRVCQRRAKVSRRRQIDPTTCERDYTAEEIEFMSAMDEYKRRSGRMFPTCSEVLEVVRSLGYEKRTQAGSCVPPPVDLSMGTIETPTVVG
jgi:hypothetical protein